MIDHTTMLRLIDAGFKTQQHRYNDYATCERCDEYSSKIFCDPTSDELIEQLADNFYILEKRGDRFYCLKPNIFNESETNFELSSGSSAKEALAMLYLYYHEKNKRNNGME